MRIKVLIIALACILPFCIRFYDGFSPDFLVCDNERGFSSFECPELPSIVSKPLFYLGEGLQSPVFSSSDDQYVFKFFFTKRPRSRIYFYPPLISWMKGKKRSSQKNKILERYDLAFRELREESGLVAVHLGADGRPLPKCKVFDAKGKAHTIDLGRVSFIIQKKGASIESIKKMDKERQVKALVALDELLESIASKGFEVLGKSFKQDNFAFLDDRAIMVDLGRVIFSKELKDFPAKEIARRKELLGIWAKTALY